VRAAAQRRLDGALARAESPWQAGPERRFASTARFKDFAEFEQRMMRRTRGRRARTSCGPCMCDC
jgi:predicted metal-dependent peptidase